MFHNPYFVQSSQQTRQNFHHPNPNSMHFFNPSQTFFHRPNIPHSNQNAQNFNFSRDFDRYRTGPNSGYNSIPTTNPNQFFDYGKQHKFDRQRWRHNRAPAFHFQDKSTSYFMSDPIRTSDDRIIIQLTKVHVGPNGDQQRVFVEQEFSNEIELNAFVQNFRQNFENAFTNRNAHENSSDHQADDSTSEDHRKPGVVVIEEPDEEPKIYQQQAYNEKIQSKQTATNGILTPPLSPDRDSNSSSKPVDAERLHDLHKSNNRRTSHDRHRRSPNRTRYVSPAASRLSSSSTTRSNRRRRNKMKYRRQKVDQSSAKINEHEDNIQANRASGVFHAPSFANSFQRPTTSAAFQAANMANPQSRASFHWRFAPPPTIHQYPFQQSRSFVVNNRMNGVHHKSEHLFRMANGDSCRRNPSVKDFRPKSTMPFACHRFQTNQHKMTPTIVFDHIHHSNREQQLPRVHRTKSDCQQSRKFQHRSQSTIDPCFTKFSPIRKAPIVQRHFIPFCSAPLILPQKLNSSPMFNSGQNRRNNSQFHLGFFNPFRLGSTLF